MAYGFFPIMGTDGEFARNITINSLHKSWPWDRMDIGEYIVIDDDPSLWGRAKGSVGNYNMANKKIPPYRHFTTKTYNDKNGWFMYGTITRTS